MQRALSQQGIDAPAQFAAIATRIGQAVDVIDAQAIDQAGADQLENLLVSGFEHLATLDPQAGQLVDVEKAPPVDVIGGGTPAGQAIGLLFEQAVQALEACRCAPVKGIEQAAERNLCGQRLQLLLQQHGLVGGLRLAVQSLEAFAQGVHCRVLAQAEDLSVIGRADRKALLMVTDVEAAIAGLEAQRDVAGLQGCAVVSGEKRQQQLTFEQGIAGVPLDIEERAVAAAPAPAQQVLPPGVVAANRHVVGDDVEDQAHAMQAQRRHQSDQCRFATECRVDAGRVDHVVAMQRTRPRTEQRRSVQVADAQPGEVGHQRQRVIEGEAGMKLQTQRGTQAVQRSRSQACSRAWASSSRRFAASASSSSLRAGREKRRRQLGWPSMVPGRLGCSSMPSRSSSGINTRGARVCPR
ncbi:hypothetical protein D3C78_994720 [compost metagenome]